MNKRKSTLSDTSKLIIEKDTQLHIEIENVEYLKEELRRKTADLVSVSEDH